MCVPICCSECARAVQSDELVAPFPSVTLPERMPSQLYRWSTSSSPLEGALVARGTGAGKGVESEARSARTLVVVQDKCFVAGTLVNTRVLGILYGRDVTGESGAWFSTVLACILGRTLLTRVTGKIGPT